MRIAGLSGRERLLAVECLGGVAHQVDQDPLDGLLTDRYRYVRGWAEDEVDGASAGDAAEQAGAAFDGGAKDYGAGDAR